MKLQSRDTTDLVPKDSQEVVSSLALSFHSSYSLLSFSSSGMVLAILLLKPLSKHCCSKWKMTLHRGKKPKKATLTKAYIGYTQEPTQATHNSLHRLHTRACRGYTQQPAKASHKSLQRLHTRACFGCHASLHGLLLT